MYSKNSTNSRKTKFINKAWRFKGDIWVIIKTIKNMLNYISNMKIQTKISILYHFTCNGIITKIHSLQISNVGDDMKWQLSYIAGRKKCKLVQTLRKISWHYHNELMTIYVERLEILICNIYLENRPVYLLQETYISS